MTIRRNESDRVTTPDVKRLNPLSLEERMSANESTIRYLRRDLEALEARLTDRVKHELEGAYAGLEAHVTKAMIRAMEPVEIQLAKIDEIAFNAESIREAMGLRKLGLDLEEQTARIVGMKVDVALKPVTAHNATEVVIEDKISGDHSRKMARLYVAMAIVTTLAGVVGAALGSHASVGVPTPPVTSKP